MKATACEAGGMWKLRLLTMIGVLTIVVIAVGALFGVVSILGDVANGIGIAIAVATMAVVVGGGAIRARQRSTPYW